MEIPQIAQILNNTFSPDGAVVHAATDALYRVSHLPNFPFSLLSIAAGGDDQGQRVAAATYLKNYIRKNIDASRISKEFRDAFMRALLQVEPAVLKVLVEGFRLIVAAEFVKDNLWPELIPELQAVIDNSNLISRSGNGEWKTINALTVLQSLIRPFQYFLNPKVAREPVPLQLELVAEKILVPLLSVFHSCVEKALSIPSRTEVEIEKILLIICKCMYFAVRSHMPSALVPLLASICKDLFGILSSLRFDSGENLEDGYLLRLKTGKRSLLIFCALVTRHRKFCDKLMPDIIKCVSNIVKHSKNISKLDFLTERIVSLAFDVISHVLETGPGWRLVSPHFSSLLNSAIFPALVLNEKDTAEWEEDADEFIRKNLPSDLEEFSGLREDLFSPRKNALNLLGVISISKGPPVVASVSSKRKKGEKNNKKYRSSMGELLVVPFLSKFPIPTDITIPKIVNDYFGVLMAYGSLVDFLGEQKPGYTENLIRNRVLPLYNGSACHPYLVASANWVLGEFASFIPEEMSADIYSSLLKALAFPDMDDISSHPVRVSAAGAITELVENVYLPPEWLPVLQVIISRISVEDEESSIMFQLLATLVEAGNESVASHIPYIVPLLVGTMSKYIPHNPGTWPQTVERGFAALAVIAQCWEASEPEEAEQNDLGNMWVSGRATIATAFSELLQQAWLRPLQSVEGEIDHSSPPSSSIDDISTLLGYILHDVNESDLVTKLKVPELLLVWADSIADWHEWEEMEDLSIFSCIKEVVYLNRKVALKNFIVGDMPSPPAPPVPRPSIIEGISAFICEAFSQYPLAIYRASSCVHVLLHAPFCSYEAEGVKQSLVKAFSHAAFSHFKDIRSKPCALWKPLLLAIASCYLCYPDTVQKILEKDEQDGFTMWACAIRFVSSSKFEPVILAESEIKLTVLTLTKLVEQFLGAGSYSLLGDCFVALMEASVRLKEVQEEGGEENEDTEDEDDGDEDSEDDNDEDSEEEHEETEEEFLERCAEAAVALENGTIMEEGDLEDHEQEIELGDLEEVDQQTVVQSLIKRYHQVLASLSLPPELITDFLNKFPDFHLYLQQPGQ